MAITVTSTGSQCVIIEGTNEEIVNYCMISGLGTNNIAGFSDGAVGSIKMIYFK